MRETGKTKHYGVHNVSHKRLILLCLENPNKKGYTLAVEYDLLDAESRSQLINVIDGPEAQSVKDSYHVLAKNIFTEHPNVTMLKYLQNGGFVKEYNVNDITLFTAPDEKIPLAEVIKQVDAYESWKFGSKKNDTTPEISELTESKPNMEPVKVADNKTESKTNTVQQADTNTLLTEVLSKLLNKIDEFSDKLDTLSNNTNKENGIITKTVTKSTKPSNKKK